MDPITTLTFLTNVSKDGQDFSVYTGRFDTFLKAEHPTVEYEEDDRTIILVCDADRKYAYTVESIWTDSEIDMLINALLD
jgi:hypothetical protein